MIGFPLFFRLGGNLSYNIGYQQGKRPPPSKPDQSMKDVMSRYILVTMWNIMLYTQHTRWACWVCQHNVSRCDQNISSDCVIPYLFPVPPNMASGGGSQSIRESTEKENTIQDGKAERFILVRKWNIMLTQWARRTCSECQHNVSHCDEI